VTASAIAPDEHGDTDEGEALPFPDGFLWGVSTSAYQIEGGTDLDGRGLSIWDTFAAHGRVRGGDTGAVAADHRRRMPEDVDLLADLGIPAYRFSIAWPRVQPDGRGAPSRSGLDFYRRLVDRLRDRGIEPVVTLYHWDLPQALEDAGGWPARDTAARFADYAAIVADAIGDRVRRWTTINEPWCAAMLGYAAGIHAPGRAEPGASVAAAHHLLLGHGLAVDALRARLAPTAEVGITLNPYPVVTAGPGGRDRDAVRRIDGLANRLWYDAVLLGRYPDDVLDDLVSVSDLSHIHDGDLGQISRPIDALGVNYYRRYHVRHEPGASAPPSEWPGSEDVRVLDAPDPATANGWRVEPAGLTEALVRLATDYDPPPLYVHESGGAFADVPGADGRVVDADRIAYLDGHLRACRDAIAAGVDLRGYFVWSFLDNFEWAEGYAHRFGLVHVDYATQRRTPKASAAWYAGVAAANALGPDPDPQPDLDADAGGRA
jgi:beta-glucosidase